MKVLVPATAALALCALSFAPSPLPFTGKASAQSASERDCVANGGTYEKDGPNSVCVYPPVTTKPGNNPPGEQGSEKTVTETDTGHGNLGNKTQTTNHCDGNKGQCK